MVEWDQEKQERLKCHQNKNNMRYKLVNKGYLEERGILQGTSKL